MAQILPYVFLSYASADQSFAERLHSAMDTFGIPHFFAPRSIPFRDEFKKSIDEHLMKTTHLVCVVSRSSRQSEWVMYEVERVKDRDVEMFPLLLEPGGGVEPLFDNRLQYIRIPDPTADELELIRVLVDSGMFAGGIVPRRLFETYPGRFPGEVFAAELLAKPVVLVNQGGRTMVRINRNDVEWVVISTPGKASLCDRYVRQHRDRCVELDRDILDFLRSGEDGERKIPTGLLPLRWASGGVLSVVKWERKPGYWVPLFFRDIAPFGWNIALGATERHPPYGVAHGDSAFQKELTSPWFFIIREFLEETLVLDSEPRTGTCSWRGLEFGDHLDWKYQRALAKAFAREPLELRRNRDQLDIQTSRRPCALTLHDDVTIDLKVVGGGCPAREDRGVLIVVNPLELGIEVVKVVEYELDRDNCMLDGEIFQIANHSHLVRQPIALVSLEYLFREFGGQDFRPEFDETAVQPSVRGSPFGQEDIHVWRWDVKKRQELWGARDSGAWERGRYAEWAARFEERFRRGLGGEAASFPATFTPATAKILNLFFHRCVWGRNLTANFPPGLVSRAVKTVRG